MFCLVRCNDCAESYGLFLLIVLLMKGESVVVNKLYLFVGLVLLFGFDICGKELVIGVNNHDEVDVSGRLTVFVDTHALWNWKELPKEKRLWNTVEGNVLKGDGTGHVYWFKIEIENSLANQYLILSDQSIDELDLYFVKDTLIRYIKSGNAFAFEKREVKVLDYFFILPEGSFTCYIRVENKVDFKSDLRIASLKYLMNQQYRENVVLGIYLACFKVLESYLLSWISYLFFIIGFILHFKGVVLFNTFIGNILFYACACEVVLLSIALAYRLKMLRREKEEAQEREIQEREDKRLYLREQAHEIKNPVHLAANYVGVLDRNLGYFNDLIAHYRELGQEGVDIQKKQEEIKKFEEAIKIELVKKELVDGVNSVEIAFNRIRDIANNFDLDPELCELTDVNKCIRDTLLIFRKDRGDHIEIREELGQIPEVFSYKGKLDQVFTNLIKNAVEAIKEKPVLKDERLFIKTSLQSEKLIIRIKDTGAGMTEETKEKVFNKFYTTKAGGTGLGLAVCKKIIEDHKGCFHIESERGKGTEFIIELPCN